MSESTPLLAARNISLTYRSFGLFNRFVYEALTDVSFDVYPGETFGVMGRNGCGKSTLLRILCDVVKPTSGSLELQQPNISRALLTLGLGFNPQLTGRNNALLSCMLQGATKRNAIAMLQEIKQFSELEDFFERPVKTYSAGMRSRLGFATAMTLNVDLLLIDETLSVGDASFNQKAEDAIMSKIHGRQTVIFVSHNAAQVKRLCNRAIWLESGKVEAEGDVSDVADKYLAFMSQLNSQNTGALRAS